MQTKMIRRWGLPVLPLTIGGWRVPHPLWCAQNLVGVDVWPIDESLPAIPILVHASIEMPVCNALEDASAYTGWAPQTAYGWSPRHMMGDPTRPLSLHAWGLAIDIDQDANPVGSPGTIPSKVVGIFKDHGFLWGGDWDTSDPMHFEWRQT